MLLDIFNSEPFLMFVLFPFFIVRKQRKTSPSAGEAGDRGGQKGSFRLVSNPNPVIFNLSF